MLRLENITQRFGPVVANDRISLEVRAGEVLALLGENGAGKSTMVKMIYGLVRPDTGAMTLRGAAYTPSKPAEARRLVANGTREIMLLGQNVNAYHGAAPRKVGGGADEWGLGRLIRRGRRLRV